MSNQSPHLGHSERRGPRIGLVGAGFIADYHLAAIQGIPAASVVGVCDADPGRARSLAERWSVPAKASLEELLDQLPDVVHILTPPPTHARLAAACLAAGRDILVEKPVTVTAHESEKLQRLASERGCHVAVNQNAIYHPAFTTVAGWARDRLLGRVEHATVWWNVPLQQFQQRQFGHWMFQSPVNILLEQAVHPFSQIVHLMGEPLECTVLTSDEIVLPSGKPFQATWNVNLRCQRGTANCFLSFGRSYFENALHLVGEDAVARADFRRNVASRTGKTKYVEPVDDVINGVRTGSQELGQAVGNFGRYCLAFLKLRPRSDAFFVSMRKSIAAYYEARAGGRTPPVSLEFGALLVRLCEEVAAEALRSHAARSGVTP